MSPNSAMYNKMFSIAAIGIDNGRGDKYEPIMGDSCVTLNVKFIATYRALKTLARCQVSFKSLIFKFETDC
jgi:hypothetical protein